MQTQRGPYRAALEGSLVIRRIIILGRGAGRPVARGDVPSLSSGHGAIAGISLEVGIVLEPSLAAILAVSNAVLATAN